MYREIALIEDAVWDHGQKPLSEEIAKIQQKHSLAKIKASDQEAFAKQVENLVAAAIADKSEQIKTTVAEAKRAETKLTNLTVSLSGSEAALATQKLLLDDIQEQSKTAQAQNEEWQAGLEAEFEAKIKSVDAALRAQHQLEGPAKLWQEKEAEHKERMKTASLWFYRSLSAMIVIIVLGLSSVLLFRSQVASWFSPQGGSGTSPLFWVTVLAVLTIITLLMWIIRLKMKEYLSERHLMIDARERRAFVQAYLGLISDTEAEVGKEKRAIIYGALFRPSSDGIVKEDGGIDPSISALVSKLLAK